MAILTAACLVLAVATQAASLTQTTRWFLGKVAREGPYELRLEFNPWFRDGVVAARAIDASVPFETPVVIANQNGPVWFVGLRLQPRRVFLDSGRIRRRLINDGEPFVVVHLVRSKEQTQWWFETDRAGADWRRHGKTPAVIRLDSFEDGLSGWLVSGAAEEGR